MPRQSDPPYSRRLATLFVRGTILDDDLKAHPTKARRLPTHLGWTEVHVQSVRLGQRGVRPQDAARIAEFLGGELQEYFDERGAMPPITPPSPTPFNLTSLEEAISTLYADVQALPSVLTAAETVEILRISPAYLTELVQEGVIRRLSRIHGRLLIPRHEIIRQFFSDEELEALHAAAAEHGVTHDASNPTGTDQVLIKLTRRMGAIGHNTEHRDVHMRSSPLPLA